MLPLIPSFANSFQVTVGLTTKELHIRFLALTPRITLDTTKPTETDAFEMASIFLSKDAAAALCKNLEQSLKDLDKYEAEMSEKNVIS